MFRTQSIAGILSLAHTIAIKANKSQVEPWDILLALLNLSVMIPPIKAEATKLRPPLSEVFFAPAASGNMDDLIANWPEFISFSDAHNFLSESDNRITDDSIRAAVDSGKQQEDPPLSAEAGTILQDSEKINSQLQEKFPVTSLWFALRESTDEGIRKLLAFRQLQLSTLAILITHIRYYANLPVTSVTPQQ